MKHFPYVVAGESERYCIAQPEARDAVGGISWWMQIQRQPPDAAELFGYRATK